MGPTTRYRREGPIPSNNNTCQRSKNADGRRTTSPARTRKRQVERRTRHLAQSSEVFHGRDKLVIRFRFVDDHRTEYSVKRMCTVLNINRSSYYKWKATKPRRQRRQVADALLGVKVKTIFEEKDQLYGAKRIAAELNYSDKYPDNDPVNHKRIARIMRMLRLRGYTKKRKVTTTRSARNRKVFADLVKRNFTAPAANTVLVGDITYLPVAGGANMYLATVIDCYSRRLVGFAIADHMRTELVEEALEHACRSRGSLAGAIFHSDHGSVYTSSQFQATCRRLQVTQSMGAIGTSADSSLAESFNATLKREVLKDNKVFANQLICRRDVFAWCVRYNTSRRHSWCKYLTPCEYESRCA
ncbi:IS3 family transposase [Corynebacterium sp. CCUG 61414]|uniref:IS3 family transposase n=1 Tax=Corynebacterium sp. CCUG 61414 TaxID=2823896 RepID=UPI002109D62B